MKNDYIIQPEEQFGKVLLEYLKATPSPKKVVFVSAFSAWQTLMRFKSQLLLLAKNGCQIRIVLGVDMGGTSKEVLSEIATWPIEVVILKNRLPGHTFHTKLYLVEYDEQAIILAGSNNLTEGGFYNNYELSSRAIFTLPEDAQSYADASSQLARFLEPTGETANALDAGYLATLLSRNDIPSESEVRERRRKQFAGTSQPNAGKSPYGIEKMPAAPPLPAELLALLEAQSVSRKKASKPAATKPAGTTEVKSTTAAPAEEDVASIEVQDAQLTPRSFYMELPKTQGNIPGEPRIPMGALVVAKDFWGWPSKYRKIKGPRSANTTFYYDYYPNWTIKNVSDESLETIQPVRLYLYPARSEFRFYARPIINQGATAGDIVCITKTGDDSYECILARQGTEEHALWSTYCTHSAPGKDRHYGYS
jgi:HKD family nuclease